MNKICVVNYVYGEPYQGFIPLYITSLKESYPEYHIRIYIDKRLNKNTRKCLDVLSEYYDGFTIIEDYEKETRLSQLAQSVQQIQRCQRWLFFDPEFLNFEAIYIGDIDLMIFKDSKPLFEQHKKHCQSLGTPYSNIRRTGTLNKYDIKNIARNIIKFGFKQTAAYMLSGTNEVIKFSGLHFVMVKDYFDKIINYIEYFSNELNLLAEGKSKRYNLCSFNNEAMLRDLVLEAGFKDCEDSTGKPYNLEENASISAYRPHHGIHLGIFRSPILMETERSLLTSRLYCDYFAQFIRLKETESYKKIATSFSDQINKLMNNMESFYKKMDEAQEQR